MAQRIAAGLALVAVLLAPQAFSLHLLSFLHAKELAYALALVCLAVLSRRSEDNAAPPRWVLALLLALTILAAISIASGPHFRAPLEKWTRALLVFGFFVAAWNAIERAAMIPWLWRALWGGGTLAALLGLLQYLHATDAWLPVFPHYDQRMYSVFGNQDLLGGYIALTLPLALAAAVRGTRVERLAAIASLGVLLPALLLSGSRSAWLAGGIASLGYLLAQLWPRTRDSRTNSRMAKGLLAALSVALLLSTHTWLPRATASFAPSDTGGNLRLWFYAGTAHMVQSAPWLGVGFGQFGFHSPAHLGAVLNAPGGERFARNELFTDHAHSDPLETLAEIGVLGAAMLLLLLGWALRGAKLRPDSATAWACFVALIVFSLLNPTLHSAPHVLIGLFSLRAILQTQDAATPSRYGLRLLHGFAPLLVALWLYTTLLPSAKLARLEDTALAPCDALKRYEAFIKHYQGPAHAYEMAVYLATECVTSSDDSSLRARVDKIIAVGARTNDTGNFHLAVARYYDKTGDQVRAGVACQKVLERWPDNAEAKAFTAPTTAPHAGSASPR